MAPSQAPDSGAQASSGDRQPTRSLNESLAKSTTDSLSSSFPWPQQLTKSIHPGHFMLAASLPFCFGAYRLSKKPLGTLVEHVAKLRSNGQLQNMAQLQEAEENVRRAVGVAVAARALSLATMGSIGTFGLLTSGK